MGEVRNGHAEITGEDAHHLTRVLRVEAGQRFEISDNRTAYLAEVEAARKNLVSFAVIEALPPAQRTVSITLYAALIRFERLEWMIEKATELGVERIVPVAAERSEHGLERAAGKRLPRWQRIAREASEQSRRDRLPVVEATGDWEEAAEARRYVLDEDAAAPPILRALPAAPQASDSIAILAGPEGGWTGRERERAGAAGWQAVSLGRNILRAETAALAGIAIVRAYWEKQ